MALLDQSALLEVLNAMRSADGGELMRRLLATILQLLVDAEASAFIGAEPHERSGTRTNQRNGTRDKLVSTATGDLTIKIPKVRSGSFFPSLLSPRRRVDVALHAVIMQAWVEGVSTRKVDDLVAALGVESGISKSEVSRICGQLDAEVSAWRTRDLGEQKMPYLFLDATYCKARVNGRVVSRAVVIATGVTSDGRREVLGVDVGDSESEQFWTEFLRGLRERGLHGVQLVISDAHSGLKAAIGVVCAGAAWQRCRVHFMRNALAKVAKGHAVTYVGPDPRHNRQLRKVAQPHGQVLYPLTMELLGDRWNTALMAAAVIGMRRFSEIERFLNIGPAVLSARLARLVELDVLQVQSLAGPSLRTDYRLTAMGRDLSRVLIQMTRWADANIRNGEPSSIEIVHNACGRKLLPEHACGCCGQRLIRTQVRFGLLDPSPDSRK